MFCVGLSALLSSELDEKDKDIDSDGGNDGAALPCYLPALMGCRNVECFEWLNRIEEGTYGVVHRAKDKKTGVLWWRCVVRVKGVFSEWL